MFYSNGDRYQGHWKDNKMHGEGVFTTAGKKQRILYENGDKK